MGLNTFLILLGPCIVLPLCFCCKFWYILKCQKRKPEQGPLNRVSVQRYVDLLPAAPPRRSVYPSQWHLCETWDSSDRNLAHSEMKAKIQELRNRINNWRQEFNIPRDPAEQRRKEERRQKEEKECRQKDKRREEEIRARYWLLPLNSK